MTEPRLFASLYLDEDITNRLAVALRQRGFEAVAAHEVGLVGDADEDHLTYATEHQMTLLTSNRDDFLRLAHEWVATGRKHHGIVISTSIFKSPVWGTVAPDSKYAQSCGCRRYGKCSIFSDRFSLIFSDLLADKRLINCQFVFYIPLLAQKTIRSPFAVPRAAAECGAGVRPG